MSYQEFKSGFRGHVIIIIIIGNSFQNKNYIFLLKYSKLIINKKSQKPSKK